MICFGHCVDRIKFSRWWWTSVLTVTVRWLLWNSIYRGLFNNCFFWINFRDLLWISVDNFTATTAMTRRYYCIWLSNSICALFVKWRWCLWNITRMCSCCRYTRCCLTSSTTWYVNSTIRSPLTLSESTKSQLHENGPRANSRQTQFTVDYSIDFLPLPNQPVEMMGLAHCFPSNCSVSMFHKYLGEMLKKYSLQWRKIKLNEILQFFKRFYWIK